MRKPFMAGNWKMNLLTVEAKDLAKALVDAVGNLTDVEVGIAPVYTVLHAVADVVKDSNIRLMSQDIHWEESGAFTGAISGPMLKEVGCTHAIIGHSERRHVFGETDQMINMKVKAALNQGIVPILCVGEKLEEREADKTIEVVNGQLKGGLDGLTADAAGPLVVAYEPVWAIGTGKTATPDQAQEVHASIRKWLIDNLGDAFAQGVRIQYGGSVKPDNVKELMGRTDIDGALVGGASLKADSFIKIARFQD